MTTHQHVSARHPDLPPATGVGLYAPDSAMPADQRLGRSDYSYHYVKRYFADALAGHAPLTEVTQAAELRGLDRLDLLFAPPHRLPPVAADEAALAVFAWEYDTIPSDGWNDNPRNDWRIPLSEMRGSIVHSQYARTAVVAALPDGYPVCSAPAPVWDTYAPLADSARPDSWSIRFRGWVLDSRQVGVDSSPVMSGASPDVADREVEFGGIVYTTVVNPDDGRKNWIDTFSAFAETFRDNADVTLLIKLVHHDAGRAFDLVTDMIYRPAPYRCRVVVVFGYLDDDSYRTMIAGSSFVVNSARGEGQCLPLMQFMSAGVPAIAPDHTAMAEYVTTDNAFVVASSLTWSHWPHDPRLMLRCMTYVIDWQSLSDAYAASWEVVSGAEGSYRDMSAAASQSLRGFASRATVLNTLSGFLPDVGGPDLTGLTR